MTSRTPNRNYPYPDPGDKYLLTADFAEFAKAIDTDVSGLESDGATALNDLSDVDLATSPAVDGQVLIFRAATGKWVAADTSTTGGATNLNGLSDVDTFTTAPVEGQVLRYRASDQQFVPYTPPYGATSMNELSDVDLDVFIPEDGHILVYRAGKYVSEAPAAAPAAEIPEKVMEWEGEWASGTAYQTGDVVKTASGTYVAKTATSADPEAGGGTTVLFEDTFDTDLSGWDVTGLWTVNAGTAEIVSTSMGSRILMKYLGTDGTGVFTGYSVEDLGMGSGIDFATVSPDGAGYSYSPKTGSVNRWDGSVSTTLVQLAGISNPSVAPVNVTITKSGGDITVTQDGVTATVTDPEPLNTGTGWGVNHFSIGNTGGDRTALAGFSFAVEEPPTWDALSVLKGATAGEQLFVENGALKFRGGNGTVTTLAPA